jgi:predicted hydrolase (HD superfamily)
MAEIEHYEKSGAYNREAAWQLVCEYTKSPSLRKHALSVETCVRAYGEREADALALPGDERAAFVEKYAIVGVLHDFDYERFPSLDDHPFAGNKILAELGWPEEIRTAILSHATPEYRAIRISKRRSSPAMS